LFEKIHQETKEPKIIEKINELLLKNNPPVETYDIDNEYLYDVIPLYDVDEEVPTPIEIVASDFRLTIINIAIAEMLEQRIVPHDGEERAIMSEFSSYKNEMKEILTTESFGELSKLFHPLIEELKSIDTELKNEILKIKMGYREKYHLDDKEYWAIFKNTS
jgi:hypothetical protein